jgi:hypothetical protein
MTYKNIIIKETAKGFSFDLVTHNWLRPNTFAKNAQSTLLDNQIKATITYYLNQGAVAKDGILYLAKEAI